MTLERIQWPDLLKAFAITLVVVGHIVSTYDPQAYGAPVARWIYSFHMPLFMMLSGMFFKYTLDKPFWPMVKLKCRTLLLPLISWTIILMIFQLITETPLSEWKSSILEWISSGGPLRGYWYLKCLFLYLIIGYISIKLFKYEFMGIIFTTILFLASPNVNFSRMMILFFWLGYCYSKFRKQISFFYLLPVTGLMVLCYMLGWQKFTYLGISGTIEYLKFLVMGASASLFWILLFHWLFRKQSTNICIEFCAWIGTVSLGIYCLHPLFYDSEIYASVLSDVGKGAPIVYLLWSFATIALCLVVIKLILKSKVLSFLLLGKKLRQTKTT